eukprot:6212358-Pleurochrysis_carterae.AAC.3
MHVGSCRPCFHLSGAMTTPGCAGRSPCPALASRSQASNSRYSTPHVTGVTRSGAVRIRIGHAERTRSAYVAALTHGGCSARAAPLAASRRGSSTWSTPHLIRHRLRILQHRIITSPATCLWRSESTTHLQSTATSNNHFASHLPLEVQIYCSFETVCPPALPKAVLGMPCVYVASEPRQGAGRRLMQLVFPRLTESSAEEHCRWEWPELDARVSSIQGFGLYPKAGGAINWEKLDRPVILPYLGKETEVESATQAQVLRSVLSGNFDLVRLNQLQEQDGRKWAVVRPHALAPCSTYAVGAALLVSALRAASAVSRAMRRSSGSRHAAESGRRSSFAQKMS